MLTGAGILDSQRACHRLSFEYFDHFVNSKELTLFFPKDIISPAMSGMLPTDAIKEIF
jgi:hypothetical protein